MEKTSISPYGFQKQFKLQSKNLNKFLNEQILKEKV